MASISRRTNGTLIIRFLNERGRRKTLTPGTKSMRQAEKICRNIEDILSARKLGRPLDPETAVWIAAVSPTMTERLRKVGLVESPNASNVTTLGQLLDAFFACRSKDGKASTLTVLGHTRRNLLAFFGSDRPITDITAGDAKDFERYLRTTARENRYDDAAKEDGLKPATVRKRISIAKQFFNDAVDREQIAKNPFAKLRSSVLGNKDRQSFITREMTAKLIEAAPDAQWKLIISLARYGGLRCPSELLALKLVDVDRAKERIRITSPKTEHHEGMDHRYIPLFPELRPYLQEVWDQAPDGEVHFITRYRSAEQNLRTTFLKIIKRAGLTPWPKPFHNLRASRQTELEEQFPSHVVCAWLGNSPTVARRHYLQVTDAHFEKAARSIFVASNALQCAANGSMSDTNMAMLCKAMQPIAGGVGDEGLEPPTPTV